jgi:hypothetical protein
MNIDGLGGNVMPVILGEQAAEDRINPGVL